jgi:hypothetical protein
LRQRGQLQPGNSRIHLADAGKGAEAAVGAMSLRAFAALPLYNSRLAEAVKGAPFAAGNEVTV